MYTSNAGMPELREEIARHLAAKYKIDYAPITEILITVGVSEALDCDESYPRSRRRSHHGDPCYVSYPACVCLARGFPVRCLHPLKIVSNSERKPLSPILRRKRGLFSWVTLLIRQSSDDGG